MKTIKRKEVTGLAEQLKLGISNREIATKEDLIDKSYKKSEVLKSLLSKVKSIFSNEEDSLSLSDLLNNSLVKFDLGFRFLPDAFENLKTFTCIFLAIDASGKPCRYEVVLTEKETMEKDASNKRLVMNAIEPSSYILGMMIAGVDKQDNLKTINMLFSIPYYNEDINKKHFVINMINFLKETNKKLNYSVAGETKADASVVPSAICDWVNNAKTAIDVLAAKRTDDIKYKILYSQFVLADNLDIYSRQCLERFHYSTYSLNYQEKFIPSVRDGQDMKIAYLYWDTMCCRFFVSRSKEFAKPKGRALMLGVAYVILDKIKNKITKQGMLRFTADHVDFIKSISINNETMELTINGICNKNQLH